MDFPHSQTPDDNSLRRGFGFRLLMAALLLALAYPLSLGPVCWTLSRFQWDQQHPYVAYAASRAYLPLAPTIINGPYSLQRGLKWWMGLGMSGRTEFHDDWPQGVGWSNPGYTYTLWHY